jgi:hypothetical protein
VIFSLDRRSNAVVGKAKSEGKCDEQEKDDYVSVGQLHGFITPVSSRIF